MAVEPLAGRRTVEITERRTCRDWAHFIRDLIDGPYANAARIVLIMDNLNTHSTASFYKAFPADEALRLSRKLEIHYPRNMAVG
jgi:hypothetical protein